MRETYSFEDLFSLKIMKDTFARKFENSFQIADVMLYIVVIKTV